MTTYDILLLVILYLLIVSGFIWRYKRKLKAELAATVERQERFNKRLQNVKSDEEFVQLVNDYLERKI